MHHAPQPACAFAARRTDGHGGGVTQGADGAAHDVACHVVQEVQIFRTALTVLDAVHHAVEPAGAFAARRALAAAFFEIEVRQAQERLHHAARLHGGIAAGAHALAFYQRELAVGGGFTVIDTQLALEVVAGALAIAQGTGQVRADGDLVLADGLDVEHVVERGDFLDRDGRNANVVGHIFDDFGSQPALLFLRDGKRGHDGGLPLFESGLCGRARDCLGGSAVDLAEHDVLRADDGDGVGNHVTARHFVQRLQVGEARRAKVHAERLVGAIGDQVAAELALGRLDRGVGFTCRHLVALTEELEVMDQRFHVGLHGGALGRSDLEVLDHDQAGVGLQPCHALLDDAVGFAHFGDADQVTVVAVAVVAQRDVEIERVVDFDPAQVRVAFEDDAVQVERFALEPAHGRPALHQRGDHGELVVLGPGAHAQAPVVLDGQQVRDHGEARAMDLDVRFLGHLAGAVAPGQVVDAAEVDTGFKAQAGFGAQLVADREPLLRGHFERQLAQRLGQRDVRAEGGLQIVFQGFEPGHHLVRLGEPIRWLRGAGGRVCRRAGEGSARNRVGQADLVLHLQQAVDQRLGRGRAARHVDVY
uniref:NAD-specific glutamate dehydrogenase n=1 Tax=Parastrongyloides trichosuri TaxID=131310 RepID=A0A0N4ZLE3_PARTI